MNMYLFQEIKIFFRDRTFEPGILYHDRERLYGSDYGHRGCIESIK